MIPGEYVYREAKAAIPAGTTLRTEGKDHRAGE